MKELAFYKSPFNDKKYNCSYIVHPFPILNTQSDDSYDDAGKKMIPLLIEECSEETFKVPFYIKAVIYKKIKPLLKKELIQIKNSLEKHIQENKLKINLEVA